MSNSASSSPTADEIRSWDNAHYVHPWESMGVDSPDRLIALQGDGIHLVDTEGRRYIDGPGGMWNVQIGYGNAEMAQAIADQVMALPFQSPWAFAASPSSVLSKRLAEMAPGDLNSIFFTTGGSSAVDTALRFAQFYNNLKGRPNKKIILAREKGYHGSTYLAASVSGKERDRTFMDTATELVRFLPDVNPLLRPADMTTETWCDEKVQDLRSMIESVGADNIAAFIAEPILASGGVIVPPTGYHRRTRELCADNDILYISDEVVTGFGRLGHWFASEPVFDIVPDMITCAKGITSGYLPMGATLISDRLLEDLKAADRSDVAFSNGFTNSAHPVCCAAALKNIEIMERTDLLAHVREVTPHFQERLHALAHHDIVADTRGMGLVGCVEGGAGPSSASEVERLQIDKEFGYKVDAACEARGLIVRPTINMCVMSPPLIITHDQIDEMFDILDVAIGEVQAASE